ncbi:leucyl aminopeptidase [Microbulbifer hydrolyticus]|uniref:Probable cytosol aminopeptidase n=1 Tax=Microbulbifer hydrolyticus TaxID=48074 RepID=A0A6P1TDH9_9GAMM|nr:leucyl aminopeptidase [Microbulbifer hydrolyticus]MBB5212057.1 leucyl aminopeptidase [Microbulbifer hydrolyticus]QHQ39735.1 leucyl aminopeptidase [Microbulbifer hydrolyticus]
MQFNAKVTDISKQRSACAIIAVDNKNRFTDSGSALDKANGGSLAKLLKRGDLGSANGSTLMVPSLEGGAERILLVRTGKTPVTQAEFRKLADASTSAIKSLKDATSYLTEVPVQDADSSWQAQQLALAAGLAGYKFTRCHSDAKPYPLAKFTVHAPDKKQLKTIQDGVELGSAQAAGSNIARELGNLPGNICTPSYLASEAKALAKKHTKLTTTVLDNKKMDALGMGAFMSVAKGSDEPAAMIAMNYKGGKAGQKPIVLVGKGITFDTGGISIKPGAQMDEMKFDMCGAASVFGVMNALVEMNAPVNVVGVVAAAENMPSGRASKPGDVVTSMSGKTIEILNTDAEGRLVLCDALTWAGKFNPSVVIDVATLTGACVIALGNHATGLYANQDKLAEDLIAAGETAGDRAWRMPLWDEYQPMLNSNFADMQNIGGREAGSVTAACFLARFAEDYDWAHLDIAGSAWKSGAAKGATGRPVPLLLQYILNKK